MKSVRNKIHVHLYNKVWVSTINHKIFDESRSAVYDEKLYREMGSQVTNQVCVLVHRNIYNHFKINLCNQQMKKLIIKQSIKYVIEYLKKFILIHREK